MQIGEQLRQHSLFRINGVMRVCAVLLLSLVILLAAQSEVTAAPNPRYASYVIDASRGIVLHERNANAKRYPASLTKLMTLYLTFEALEKGKVKWSQSLPVSARAAKQPQTNISLNTSDKIKVGDAIKALIVRSANDASVVLAEAIGKTEWNFAVMMTQKARELGMDHTQFRNPHGLPDSNQYTTASDMAVLALALRRDFPDYYKYFKTETFTFKGRTYTSHNKVTRFYKGADGLKTGYINASGFNLVTSVRRDGQDIVAVVLGGKTSRSRDNHMISLLDSALVDAPKTNNFLYAFNGSKAPTPASKPSDGVMLAKEKETVDAAPVIDVASAAQPPLISKELVRKQPSQIKVNTNTTIPAAVAKALKDETLENDAVAMISADVTAPAPAKVDPVRKKQMSDIKAALDSMSLISAAHAAEKPLSMEELVQNGHDWGIQVGTYSKISEAMTATAYALQVAAKPLEHSVVSVSNQGSAQDGVHRARLAGLSKQGAKEACAMLRDQQSSCFVYKLSSIR